MKDFSLIIVTHNSESVIKECITSIRNMEYERNSIEVLIVDNASSDGTRDIVKEHCSDAKLIALSENYGYAYACNRGIENSQGKAIVLLNPDVIVDRGFLKNVRDYLNKQPLIGAIVPRMTDTTGRLLTYPKIPTLANRIYKYCGLYGILNHDETLYHDLDRWDGPHIVNNIEGPAVIFPRAVFSRIGYLNEKFFLTHELSEFSLRAQRKGLRLFYLPTAHIIHLITRSSGLPGENLSSVVHEAEIMFFKISFGKIRAKMVRYCILGILGCRMFFEAFTYRGNFKRTKKLFGIFREISI